MRRFKTDLVLAVLSFMLLISPAAADESVGPILPPHETPDTPPAQLKIQHPDSPRETPAPARIAQPSHPSLNRPELDLRPIPSLPPLAPAIGPTRTFQNPPSPEPVNPDEKLPPPEKNPAAPSSSELALRPYWKDGLFFESSDKRFKLNVGGRTQFDAAWMIAPKSVQFGPNGVGRVDDAVNFRRARLDVSGTLFGTVDFFSQYDFLNTFVVDRVSGIARPANTPVPTDLWIAFTQLPRIGTIKIGNQKPPISFEHLTSSRFLNFLERSMGFDAFIEDQDNGFRPGIQIFNTAFDDRMTMAIGYFKHTRNIFGWNTGDGEGDVTGRITMLPIYECDGRFLVHLGVGASHRDLDDHVARFRGRTMVRNGPAVLHTILADASMVGKNQQLVVPEMAIVWGPFSLQAEYFATWVNGAAIPAAAPPRVPQGTVFFHAYTVEAHYFLTGEHRAYNKKSGAFGRQPPNRNLRWGKERDEHGPGWGAWQVAIRYQFLDLEDKGINGSIVNEFTAGLNWFLNPNMKVQWNYSLADRNSAGAASDGIIHSFGTRLAWDF